MEKARLINLLNVGEVSALRVYDINLNKFVSELTVSELSNVWTALDNKIKGKYVISANAIEELTNRCIKNNLAVL